MTLCVAGLVVGIAGAFFNNPPVAFLGFVLIIGARL